MFSESYSSRVSEPTAMEDKENAKDKPSAIPDADEQQQQSVPFPAFIPKWPLTHSERIEELDRYLPFYQNSPQRHNIIALKEWHAQYPGDEIVSNETVWFERGKKVEPSEIVAGAFEVWEEVSKKNFL